MQLRTNRRPQHPGFAPVPASGVTPGALAGRSLILDVTSFLLASHFEFLAAIEMAFRPVRVSTALINSLHLIRDQLSAARPQPAELWCQVLQFVDSGSIGSVSDEFFSTPPHQTRLFRVGAAATPGSAIISLDELFQSVVEPGSASIRLPQPRDVIVCPASVLLALARRDLIEMASSRFALVIQESELNRIRTESQPEPPDAHQLLSWFDDRINHLHRGLAAGAYEIQPVAIPAVQSPSSAAFSRCILELCPSKVALLWVAGWHSDLHYGSAHTPIVDVVQLLTELREVGRVTQDDVHAIMFRMRQANILCLPFTPAEILSHLQSAELQSGSATESDYLSTMRRNVSLSLECGCSSSQREIVKEYATSLLYVAEEAMVRCWVGTGPTSYRTAGLRADWLLENLYLAALAILPTDQSGLRLARGFAGMIARAYSSWPGLGHSESPRQSCLAWLEFRLDSLSSSAGILPMLHAQFIGLPPPIHEQFPFDPLLQDCLGFSDTNLHHLMDPTH